jgi:3'-phosphoadenosine 5'-phosphosulfate sulfotransferase (PAPS reductase)/FAD synthetase
MEVYELRQMQSLPLRLKIKKTIARIEEWYNFYDGKVWLSFSGGFNSTILADIISNNDMKIPFVFSNTGLEYPEINKFVRNYGNVKIVTPKKSFKWVLENKGYPVISKQISRMIRDIQQYNDGADNFNVFNLHMTGFNQKGVFVSSQKLPDKYLYLINAPFKISEQCCEYIKKEPLHTYMKETQSFPFTAQMAEDSKIREKKYLQNGCNNYNYKYPISNPVGFWTQQDMFKYALEHETEYCGIYGKIIEENGSYKFTGEQRTGCMFCMLGINFDGCPNRFQRMKISHPKLYDFCLDQLGIGKVLDFIKISK